MRSVAVGLLAALACAAAYAGSAQSAVGFAVLAVALACSPRE